MVRHIRHANGIWLDIGNTNDRLTGNVFADIPGDVNPHAIQIEGSDAWNEIDNNIFDHFTGGILIRDTNHVIIAYNLFVDCAKVCIDTASGLGAPRPINGHTNDSHDLRVFGNVFAGIGQSAIEFNNPRNTADGNVYGFAPGRRAGMQPYLRVKFPEPPEWDNLESWRDQHDWDKTGTTAEVATTFNPDALQMSVAVKGDVKALPVYGGIDVDFYGHQITGTNRMPGPFADLTLTAGSRAIDPR